MKNRFLPYNNFQRSWLTSRLEQQGRPSIALQSVPKEFQESAAERAAGPLEQSLKLGWAEVAEFGSSNFEQRSMNAHEDCV